MDDEREIDRDMWYCEFGEMIDGMDDLDGDVICIESCGSEGDLIEDLEDINYDL
uniref:hypothetical protein n=1 Tax=Staphylococcus epidermidis TaxID=1282 RepID=UPI00119D407B